MRHAELGRLLLEDGQVFLTGGKPVFRGLVMDLWLSVATATTLQDALAGGFRVDSSDPVVYAIALLLLACAATIAMADNVSR